MNRRWALAVALVALTAIIYLPALHADFLWDDDVLLTDNLLVRTTSGLWKMWIPSKAIDYYPVTWASFWFECRLWGLDPTGYHLTNILLHVLGALFVWQILERLKVRGAWLAALLFAIHPVNVESVAWVSERKNTLSLVFYALTMLAFLRYERAGHRRWYWGALGLFLLALLSKTSGLMLPAILMLAAWWQRGTITRRDLLRCVPFLVLALAFAGLTVWTQSWAVGAGTTAVTAQRGLLFRLGAAGHVFWFYLFKCLLPVPLMTVYPLWKFDSPGPLFWLPALFAGVAFIGAWLFRKTWGKVVLFGLSYFGLMLLPVLGILNALYIGRSPVVTDHLQYLPMIGIVSLIAAGLTQLPAVPRNIIGITIVGVLGCMSWQRVIVHQNQETLWADTLAKNPTSGTAHFMLGVVYEKRGDLPAAITQYTESLRLSPRDPTTQNNLANAYSKSRQFDASFTHYAEALRLKPNFPDAQRNWANALSQAGRYNDAIPHYTAALQLNPADPLSHNNLGVALAAQQQLPEACAHFAAAARLAPKNLEYRENVARCHQAGQ